MEAEMQELVVPSAPYMPFVDMPAACAEQYVKICLNHVLGKYKPPLGRVAIFWVVRDWLQ
jgi:hypothetical protein